MHLAEAVLAVAPGLPDALAVKLAATERQLERAGREKFSEVRWLEAQIGALRQQLGMEVTA